MNIIRIYKSDQKIVDYIKTTSRSIYSSVFYKWQYECNYNHLYVLEKEGEYFGTQGMLEYILYDPANGLNLRTMKSETTYVSPTLRGTGNFEKLYQFAVDDVFKTDYLCVWGFTVLDNVWKNKLNFEVNSSIIDEAVIFVQPDFILCRSFRNIVKFIRDLIFSSLTSLSIKTVKLECKVQLSSNISQILQDFKLEKEVKFGVRMDYKSSFFRNRVDFNPILNYKICFIKNGLNEVEAFAIFVEGDNLIRISDLYAANDKQILELLKFIYSIAKEKKLNKILFFGNNTNVLNKKIFSCFKKLFGLVRNNEAMKFVVKFNPSKTTIDYSSWRMNGLWTEGFSY